MRPPGLECGVWRRAAATPTRQPRGPPERSAVLRRDIGLRGTLNRGHRFRDSSNDMRESEKE